MFGFLKKDPASVLEKAEEAFARGEAREALRRVDKLLASGAFEHRERAEELRRRAAEALIEAALERAGKAEQAGFLDDAAEWVESAWELLPDEDGDPENAARKAGLEARLATLRQRADAQLAEAEEREALEDVDDLRVDHEMDTDEVYGTLVEMLTDRVAPLYRDRPEEFRHAVVDVNEGRGDEALAVLDALVADRTNAQEQPDPILHLERGRARTLTEDFEGAMADLDLAWQDLGADPLDHTGTSSPPTLWAYAAHGANQAALVVERLAPLADRTDARPELILAYGEALELEGQWEAARDLWLGALGLYPRDSNLSRHLARALETLGEPRQAIGCLELAIAPSCKTGCAAPPKDIPAFRQLAALYLEEETLDTGRAGELLEAVSLAQAGRMTHEDATLAARFHRATGNPAAAQELEARLEELALQEPEDLDPGLDLTAATAGRKRAAL